MNREEIHNLLKIENDKTTIFTNKELKMIDDYINELEAYKYNMNRDYLRLEKENEELKKQLEEKNKPQIFIDTQDIEERYAEGLYQDYLEEENKKYKNQQKEFIEWLEDEKDECSQIYEDDLGKTRLVNEDIFNEVDKILSKYEDIIDK